MSVIQIVIPLHKSGGKLKDDSELRFVLRSLERHFKEDFAVTIVGERLPKWADGLNLLKCKGGLKSALKLTAATFPEGFFWCYDDCVLIKDTNADQMKVSCACKAWTKASTGWARMLEKIKNRLSAEGFTPWDYSRPHGPYWFDKGMVDEGFKDWPGMAGKFPWESWILSKRDWPRRHGVVKQYYGAFKEPPGERSWFVNFNEKGFSVELRKFLYDLFPMRCRFEKGRGVWTVGAKAGSDKYSVSMTEGRVTKTELQIDEKRRNRLFEEALILMDLNSKGCPCVPRLLDFGIDEKGKHYMVTERIHPVADAPSAADVFLSYQAVRACGYEHGDLMEQNVIFDGKIAWLIDFDRAYKATDEFNWGTVANGQIDPGLEAAFLKFINEPFNLKNTALGADRHIYHSVAEATRDGGSIFLQGERDLSGRFEILDQIDFAGERVLDVGCNLGVVTRYVRSRGASVADGIEFNPDDAKLGQFLHCLSPGNTGRIVHGRVGEGAAIPGTYDTVLLFSVFHHLLNPVAAAQEIGGCCGRILLEAKLNEAGHWYGGKGNTHRLPKWNFKYWDELTAHIERIFPGFKFTADYGKGDRGRKILEFRKEGA